MGVLQGEDSVTVVPLFVGRRVVGGRWDLENRDSRQDSYGGPEERVLTRFVLKYTLTAQPEPSVAHEL